MSSEHVGSELHAVAELVGEQLLGLEVAAPLDEHHEPGSAGRRGSVLVDPGRRAHRPRDRAPEVRRSLAERQAKRGRWAAPRARSSRCAPAWCRAVSAQPVVEERDLVLGEGAEQVLGPGGPAGSSTGCCCAPGRGCAGSRGPRSGRAASPSWKSCWKSRSRCRGAPRRASGMSRWVRS